MPTAQILFSTINVSKHWIQAGLFSSRLSSIQFGILGKQTVPYKFKEKFSSQISQSSLFAKGSRQLETTFVLNSQTLIVMLFVVSDFNLYSELHF